jgi:hypothetical protein
VLLLLGATVPARAATARELLSRYTPTLKYEIGTAVNDTPDGYHADSAAEITNNYINTNGLGGDCPRLQPQWRY